jgi:5-methylcytosine-specific restriction protein A
MPTDIRHRNPDWDEDELVLALDVYLSAKPADLQKNSPEVADLSAILRRRLSTLGVVGEPTLRNVAGVYMKLQNLKAHDPDYVARGRTGLSAGNRLERAVWERYGTRPTELHQRAVQLRSFIASDPDVSAIEDDVEPDDAPLSQEGRLLVRVHKRYERNATNRARKLTQFRRANEGRVFCECCGFDFERVYGQRGSGFIEVHHTLPVSRLTPDQRLSLDDLRLLCANCHRMVHVSQPWLTVDEVRALLKNHHP